MKKVQDYLKELDREKLIDAYFERIPGGNAGIFDDEYLTEENMRDEMREFISYLSGIKAEELECNESFVLLAYPQYDDMDYHGRATHSLICEDSLGADCRSEYDYKQCYNTSTHGEIVGLKVADTEYTREHIYELMAQVFYQALLFGLRQEGFARADGSSMAGYWYKTTYKEFESVMANMELDFGEDEKIDDDEAFALWSDIEKTYYAACERYNDFCFDREIKELRELTAKA